MNWEILLAIIRYARHALCRLLPSTDESDRAVFPVLRSLPGDEAALILARFYQAPPASPGRTGFENAYRI